MAYPQGLEILVAKLWAQATGVAPSDVLVRRHGPRAGIVVKAPGEDRFFVDLDAFYRACAAVAFRRLTAGGNAFARVAELEACLGSCLARLEPREAAETLPAPPGAEAAE